MSTVKVSFFPAPAALAHAVVGIRAIVHTHSAGITIKTCPNGTPGIIFQFGDGSQSCIQSITTRSSKTTDPPALFLHGLGSEPSIMRFRAGSHVTIQVVLRPHALFSLFGMDASALAQRLVGAPEFGAAELQSQLIAHTGLSERIHLLQAFLLSQQKLHGNNTDSMVDQALELIQAQVSTVTVKSLLEQLQVSERQLHKRFLRAVGCSPQQYIRVRRVNEALRLIRSGEYKRLSDVAYALHYYDQSHFIRDIKALSWLTPKGITQSVTDFQQDEAGVSYS